MAILTAAEIDYIRQGCIKDIGVATARKPIINAAIQAIEDTLAGAAVQTALNNAINTATTPLVLTATEKRLLIKWVLKSRFDRGNN